MTTPKDHRNAITKALNGHILDQDVRQAVQGTLDYHLDQIIVKTHRQGFDACSQKVINFLDHVDQGE